MAAEKNPLVSTLHDARSRFLELVAELRPDLHRYCARMTGSVADGEDIVQETLARAYYALAELEAVPPLRPWLFQIAHNRALDYLRRYDRRMGQPLDASGDSPSGEADDPEELLARDEATRAAISRFSELVPVQRSSVILKDVLGHSVDEIAVLLELSVPAVKAALHRGRERLRVLAESAPREAMSALVADLRAKIGLVSQGGDDAAREKHVGRGKLLPRERVRRLLDPGSPFLELSQLAAWIGQRQSISRPAAPKKSATTKKRRP